MIKIKVYISILYLLCISCKNSEIAQGTPESISKEIKKILHDELKNPPIKVYSYIYENQKVYFFTSYCCDIPSRLYNSEGEIICHPDGGLTGKGDLKCLDFFQKATNMKLVWQDSRNIDPVKQ